MEKEPEVLEGVVEDIIYKNDENGYTVARVELDDGGAITATLIGCGDVTFAFIPSYRCFACH